MTLASCQGPFPVSKPRRPIAVYDACWASLKREESLWNSSDYRARIDQIDRQLVELFAQRMNTAAGIAAYKKEHGLRCWTLSGSGKSCWM